MKRTIFSLFFSVMLTTCFSQFVPSVTKRGTSVNTMSDSRLIVQLNFIVPRYPDTAAANADKGIDSLGAIIFTYDCNCFSGRVKESGSKRWKALQFLSSLDAWLTEGNPGTDTVNNYIGTTDGVPLIFRTNLPAAGGRVGYLDYNDKNVSFGSDAYQSNNSGGIENVAIGWSALSSNTTGANEIAIGTNALQNLRDGARNIAIGIDAGRSNISGGDNIYIGNYAGKYMTDSSGYFIVGTVDQFGVDGEMRNSPIVIRMHDNPHFNNIFLNGPIFNRYITSGLNTDSLVTWSALDSQLHKRPMSAITPTWDATLAINATAARKVTLATGSTSLAPILFVAGAPTTTKAAGQMMYNTGLWIIDSSASKRDTIATRNYVRNNSSGGSISAPNTEIVYGTGSGVGSSSDVTYNGTNLFKVNPSGDFISFSVDLNNEFIESKVHDKGLVISTDISTLGDYSGVGLGNKISVDDQNNLAYYDNTVHTGKFGVNTSTPSVAFDLVGIANFDKNIGLGNVMIDAGRLSDEAGLYGDSDNPIAAYTNDGSNLYTYANGNLYVKGANVGIGTNNPSVALDVVGDGKIGVNGTYTGGLFGTSVSVGEFYLGDGIGNVNGTSIYGSDVTQNLYLQAINGIGLNGIVTVSNLSGTGSRAVLADASGVLSATGGVVPTIVASADSTALSATDTNVTTYTPAADGSYQILVYSDITAISAATLTITCTYTDTHSNTRTATFYGMGTTTAGIGALGSSNFPPIGLLRVKGGTAITVVSTFAGVSITYDVSAKIIAL